MVHVCDEDDLVNRGRCFYEIYEIRLIMMRLIFFGGKTLVFNPPNKTNPTSGGEKINENPTN